MTKNLNQMLMLNSLIHVKELLGLFEVWRGIYNKYLRVDKQMNAEINRQKSILEL